MTQGHGPAVVLISWIEVDQARCRRRSHELARLQASTYVCVSDRIKTGGAHGGEGEAEQSEPETSGFVLQGNAVLTSSCRRLEELMAGVLRAAWGRALAVNDKESRMVKPVPVRAPRARLEHGDDPSLGPGTKTLTVDYQLSPQVLRCSIDRFGNKRSRALRSCHARANG